MCADTPNHLLLPLLEEIGVGKCSVGEDKGAAEGTRALAFESAHNAAAAEAVVDDAVLGAVAAALEVVVDLRSSDVVDDALEKESGALSRAGVTAALLLLALPALLGRGNHGSKLGGDLAGLLARPVHPNVSEIGVKF